MHYIIYTDINIHTDTLHNSGPAAPVTSPKVYMSFWLPITEDGDHGQRRVDVIS